MSSLPQVASEPTEVASVDTKKYASFEIWGMKLPLPPWAVYCISAFVVIGSGGSAYLKFVHPILRERTAVNQVKIDESSRHIYETPESETKMLDAPDAGLLVVRHYSSDGCLLILRRNAGRNQAVIPTWIPAKSIEAEAAPGRLASNSGFQFPGGYNHRMFSALMLLPASVKSSEETETQVCTGRCVNPHQGPFNWWNGEQKGCWIAVWRRWQEGCQHYQWFNTCNGYWDSEPTGAPRVYWTCCVH